MPGVDVEQFLKDLDAAGAKASAIGEEILARTSGALDLSAARVTALVEEACRVKPRSTVEQVHADLELLENELGRSFTRFVEESGLVGRSPAEVSLAVIDATDGRVRFGAPRIRRLLEHALSDTPPRETPAPAQGCATGASTGAASPAGSRKPTPRARRGTRAPRASTSPARLRKLEQHLDHVLGSPSRDFVLKRARIAKSQGALDSEVFGPIADLLRKRGARGDLTGAEIEGLAQAAGWRSTQELAREAAVRREASGRARRQGKRRTSTGQTGEPRGFWARVATQSHIRAISGGLPGLGKRR